MGWETITPQSPGRKGYVSIRHEGGRIRFHVSSDIVAKLGWKVGMKAMVYRGNAEHAGKLRVVVGTEGRRVQSNSNTKSVSFIGRWHTHVKLPAHAVSYELDEKAGELIVFYDGPRKAEPAEPQQRLGSDELKR